MLAADLAFRLELNGASFDQTIAALSAIYTQTATAIALLGDDDYRANNAKECFVDAAHG